MARRVLDSDESVEIFNNQANLLASKLSNINEIFDVISANLNINDTNQLNSTNDRNPAQ